MRSLIEGGTSITISSDGAKFVYVASRAGVRQIYVRAVDDTQTRPIAGTEGAAGPFLSPNAQWIGFFQQGKLKKVPIGGGAPQILADAPLPRGADWGDDDNIYYAPGFVSGIWKVPALGGAAVEVTKLDRSKGEISHRYPQLLPGGKALVFTLWTGPEQDARNTYIQILATGEKRVLLRGAESGRYVTGGYMVAFRSGALLATAFDLETLSVPSSPPVTLMELVDGSAEGGAYAFSASGSLAYVQGNSATFDSRLAWVDRTGNIQEFSVSKGAVNGLRLSPDGRHAAVESALRAIDIYDFARATMTPFALNTAGASQGPLWSPDGTHIVYRGTRSGFRNLYWKAVDGTGEEERLTTSDNGQTPGSFSPDSKWLTYDETDTKTGSDIWVLRLDGERKPQVSLKTNASEGSPSFSRDGRWLAYQSNESGRNEVYVRPFPGPGAKVQISTEGGGGAVWSRNGRELFFRTADKMMAADVSTQSTFAAGPPHMLFQGRFATSGTGIPSFDVDKDGRFLMVPDPRPEQATTQVNIVLNWFEELKKLVPSAK